MDLSTPVAPAATTTASAARSLAPPLYVDLDGTLIRTDLLVESALAYLRSRPWGIPSLFRWSMRGRAALKAGLAAHYDLDPACLPYREEVLEFLRAEAATGRRIVLATAANESLAGRVADWLSLFDDVLASTDEHNLKGAAKLRAIREHSAGKPFSYLADDRSDVSIWSHAQTAILVNPTADTRKRAAAVTTIAGEFRDAATPLSIQVRAMRPHQWLKNLLVFIPLITAHLWTDLVAIGAAFLAFVAFSFCASSVYLVNDVFDMASDRAHPRKRARPIASGVLPVGHALLLAVTLLIAGIATGAFLGVVFLRILGFYIVATTAYSLYLKSQLLIDVFTLALLYTLRIIAGAAAVVVLPSFWLIVFSMFVFLSLALLKRYSELVLPEIQRENRVRGRDYLATDATVVQGMGIATGTAAALVFAMYINSDEVVLLYPQPQYLWPLCGLILYWIARVWVKAGRGQMHDDPLVFTARDPVSWIVLIIGIIIVGIAGA